MSGKSAGNPNRVAWSIVASLVAFILLFAAGCGGSSSSGGSTAGELKKLGKGEGQLNLVE